MGLLVVAPFLLGCLLVVLGLGFYLGAEQPKHLALSRISKTAVVLVEPQPLEVSVKPPILMALPSP
jgi:hypothetical protein